VAALVEELPVNSEYEEVDALEELPIDHEKEDVTALCPWRAYIEEVLAQMVAPGPVRRYRQWARLAGWT
jgi:hypothetical protein